MKTRRLLVVFVAVVVTVLSLVAFAAPKKPAKPSKSRGHKREKVTDAGPPAASEKVERERGGDAGHSAAEDRQANNVKESKQSDAGSSYKFGELEIDGRLKTPQIVYFLRRVRAEFSAQDLGHRTFKGELHETKKESSF